MRTCALLTESRADWGLIRPVLRALRRRPDASEWLIGTLGHECMGEIRAEGALVNFFEPRRHFTMGRVADWFVVLGDRPDVLRAAVGASIAGMRVAHICGGDRALGIQDDSWRHAISKLAHIHFVTCAESATRLKRMGERNIHQVGSPGLDDMPDSDAAVEFEIVLLLHPTGRHDDIEYQDAIRVAGQCREIGPTLWLAPNRDPGHEGIRRAMHMMPPGCGHLPRAEFLGLLRRCRAFVTNSSSGVVEAGFLGVRALMVGDRQLGRADGVAVGEIHLALPELLARPKPPPDYTYGDGNASDRIAEILATCDMPPLRKLNAY